MQKSWRLFWLSGLNELATTAKEQRSASVRYNLQLVGLEWAKRGATMGFNGGACWVGRLSWSATWSHFRVCSAALNRHWRTGRYKSICISVLYLSTYIHNAWYILQFPSYFCLETKRNHHNKPMLALLLASKANEHLYLYLLAGALNAWPHTNNHTFLKKYRSVL